MFLKFRQTAAYLNLVRFRHGRGDLLVGPDCGVRCEKPHEVERFVGVDQAKVVPEPVERHQVPR